MPSRSATNNRSHSRESINVSETSVEDRLRAFVERIESIEADIKERNDDKSEVYAEAKGTGFDPQIIKIVIKRRRKGRDAVQTEESLIETYERALAGGSMDGLAHVESVQARAREHGRADAAAGNREHENLYSPGSHGHGDYALGRQEIEMAGQRDARDLPIGDPLPDPPEPADRPAERRARRRQPAAA
jgi:uncharacterized protein (UPF0335 family)